MATRRISQFFNKPNLTRIWRLLLDEDVAPDREHLIEITTNPYRHGYTKTTADDEMMQAVRGYFDSIGLDSNRSTETRIGRENLPLYLSS